MGSPGLTETAGKEAKEKSGAPVTAQVILICSVCLAFGCGAPPANKLVVPPTPTPSPINGSPVLKNTNVSFNTYSREWPVGWEWIDPDPHPPTHHDTDAAVLRVIVPKGRNMSGDNRTAPRYLKAISGDFEMETKVLGRPVFNYQGAGLLMWRGEKDYVRFERAYGAGGAGGLRVVARKGDEETEISGTTSIPSDEDETRLRVVRAGDTFVFLWRAKDDASWHEAARYAADYPSSILAGVLAVNTAQEFDVRFGYIRLERIGKK